MNMKNKKKVIKNSLLSLGVIASVAVSSVATGFGIRYWDYLMSVTGKSDSKIDTEISEKAASLGDDAVQEIAENSMVLLKNENNCLPLSRENRKINLFGYGSTANGFIYSGHGSSGSILNYDSPVSDEVYEEKVVTPQEAFEREGFEINKDLMKLYTDFSTYNATKASQISNLYEPQSTIYTREVLRQAKNFSETAVIFISRKGSESTDVPLTQKKYNGKEVTDNKRTYLQLSTEEEEMIEVVTDNFANVIIVFNTGSPIEAGFLNDSGIDAALYAGIPGQSGSLAIPRLLKGYKTTKDSEGNEKEVSVTPSGRTSDTYSYFTREFNPTDANMFPYPHEYTGHGQISYTESLYFGYRWYETADKEGYFDDVTTKYGKGYDGVVQYPFGYGLSYGTDFRYAVEYSLPEEAEIKEDSKIKVMVTVTNDASAKNPGKEVVQIYGTPEYHKGEIEKSEVNLLAFAKTETLKPGVSQKFEFEFSPYDLACYDDYGKNPGNHKGYELDRGSYTISIRDNAHTLKDCKNNSVTYLVKNTINIDKDPVTGNEIKNRFTGDDAYLDMPIDGSKAGGDSINFVSRSDFKSTFPKARTPDRTDTSKINQVNTQRNTEYDSQYASMPTTNAKNNLFLVTKEDGSKASLSDLSGKTGVKLKYNEELMEKLGKNYDDEDWDKLLDQMSVSEMGNMVSTGFFGTQPAESIGKPQRLDIDGPAGFHYNSATEEVKNQWIAYPTQSLMGCSWSQETCYNMGQAQGVLAAATNVNGWYGPGFNLHRNPYSGRFFEYYSEDPILTGKLGSEVIRGATNKGLTCYMKHFAASEEGTNPDNVKTWLTEQALREIYLKPFEIATKEGKANAVMTAFSCIGAVWSSACDPMNNKILRGEWGFRGSLLSDWALGDYRNWMEGMLAIRGGNDFMLDSNEPFESGSTVSVNLARNATKNILYTFCNTYYLAKEHEKAPEKDDRYNVSLDITVASAPHSFVPYLMIAGVWIFAAVSSGVCIFFMVHKPKKEKPGKE